MISRLASASSTARRSQLTGLDAGTETIGDCLSTRQGTVDDAEFCNAFGQEIAGDRRGRSAGPQQDDFAIAKVQCRDSRFQVCQKAQAIRACPVERSVLHIDGVEAAEAPGLFVRYRDESEDLFLVRHGHVAAGEAIGSQSLDESAEILRFDRETGVASSNAIGLQPVAMNQRRARMGNRPADDAGLDHDAISPSLRRKSSSGRRGRPRITLWSPEMRLKSWRPSPSTL